VAGHGLCVECFLLGGQFGLQRGDPPFQRAQGVQRGEAAEECHGGEEG
jgi:hypothetical protein